MAKSLSSLCCQMKYSQVLLTPFFGGYASPKSQIPRCILILTQCAEHPICFPASSGLNLFAMWHLLSYKYGTRIHPAALKAVIVFPAIFTSHIYAALLRNLLIKYCCPFPVTFGVREILLQPFPSICTDSLISNNPMSILFCVGKFQSLPFLLIR